MRAVSLSAILLFSSLGFLAFATPAAADPVCVLVPDADGHVKEVCIEPETCKIEFCIDGTDPKATLINAVTWLRDELTCTCPPH